MGTPIRTVEWVEKNEALAEFLDRDDLLTLHPIDQGFEAEVMKISSSDKSFVLKIWNKRSKPDVSFQYQLLQALFERGLAVSKPLGWGINPNGEQVLLTTFDGLPISEVDEKKMTEIANILSSIHQLQVSELGNLQLPKYDFIDYFFPGVSAHADLNEALLSLVPIAKIEQKQIIHGDFHLRNILAENDRYTVIDWTNGQLGDLRYDFAWSLLLLKLYVSDWHADLFQSAYLSDHPIQPKELATFEALACLRWILLGRSDGVPRESNTLERVKGLLASNSLLSQFHFSKLNQEE